MSIFGHTVKLSYASKITFGNNINRPGSLSIYFIILTVNWQGAGALDFIDLITDSLVMIYRVEITL